jgi:hypothetical protein
LNNDPTFVTFAKSQANVHARTHGGDDTLEFTTSQGFTSRQLNVGYWAGDGKNTVSIASFTNQNTADLRPLSGTVKGVGYAVGFNHCANVTVNAGGTANLTANAGKDVLIASPKHAWVYNLGAGALSYDITVDGFATINASGLKGGLAKITGST